LSWKEDYNITDEEMLVRAELICQDPAIEHLLPVVIKKSQDHRNGATKNIFQLKTSSTKEVIVQVQDTSVDGEANAMRAIQVLQVLHNVGATKADLERCKGAGVLFGKRIGKGCKKGDGKGSKD